MNFLSKTIGKLPVKNIDFSPVVERELANRAFAETLQREKEALGNYIESSQNAKTGTQEGTAQPVQIEAGIQATPEPNRQTNFKNAVYDLIQSELTKEQAPTYRNPSDVIAGFSTGQTGKEKLVNGLTALAGYLNSSSGRSLISNLTGAAAYAPSRHAAYQKSLYEMEEDRQRGASNSARFDTLIKLMSHLDDVDLKNRKFDFEKERAKVGDEQWEKEFGLNMKKFEEDVRVHGLDYAAKQQELALRRAGLYEQIRSNKAQEGIAREKAKHGNPLTFSSITSVRKEFNSLPSIKTLDELDKQNAEIHSIYSQYLDGKLSANMTDQKLIMTFNKYLDEDSVVRESEFERTAQGQSILNRLKGYKDKVEHGGSGLSNSERADLVKSMALIHQAAQKRAQQDIEAYSDLALRYNINPSDIMPRHYKRKQDSYSPKAQHREKKIGNYIAREID